MATYLHNILPSKVINFSSPTTALYQKVPSYSHLKVFGCLCFPHNSPPTHKLLPRSTPCVFLGYPSHHRGYICYDFSHKRFIISRHVIFDENVFPYATSQVSPNSTPETPNSTPKTPNSSFSTSPFYQFYQPHGNSTSEQPNTPIPNPLSHPLPLSCLSPLQHLIYPKLNLVLILHPLSITLSLQNRHLPRSLRHPMTTRSQNGIHKPNPKYACLSTSSTISPLPKSHIHALRDPNWHNAMVDEFDALIKNDTWELVPRPLDVNIIRCMWIFTHKLKSNGSLERYKARLSQQVGVDCTDMFSPVVKPAIIRMVLSLALSKKWDVHQLDVNNAFLHGTLQETVYIHQPPGFRDDNFLNHVCRLKRSLYGLKQAPRAWYQRFAAFITSIASQIINHGSDIAYLLLYVDDIILTVSTDLLRRNIILKLGGEFAMKDLGQLNYFLGISVCRNTSGLFLSQEKYAREILIRANMVSANSTKTPVDTKSKLSAASGLPVSDPTLYRSLAGALQYLTFTRPDISYVVQQVCLFMHDPRKEHMHALRRILQYVKGTLSFGLQITPSDVSSLIAYTDADWGGCPDTRRSTSGYCVFLGDNLISWSSKDNLQFQDQAPKLNTGVLQMSYPKHVGYETFFLNLSVLFRKQLFAIYLSGNPVQHQCTKHVEIDIHFVREKVAKGQVRVLHVPTRFQYADIFTKGLPKVLFDDFRSSLRIRKSPALTTGD
ncbi:hypothetical protein OSB04_025178 [Centaurea solstitialis]|uniref:Reverse transcriptase Ty1/copia-type domain-containing protein n=1 Tax=Centaurea solstitialis TaxID=347529 RepID=A0AA38SZ94_9ASTR|nr:hypothetical protein OSB04_025178 [Centaurea solstitialis]